MSEAKQNYFLCIKNDGYAASLQVRTVYLGISDPDAESHRMLRIVDESGEDYLFPANLFVPISVPEAAIPVFRRGGLTRRLERTRTLRFAPGARRSAASR